MNRYGPSIFIEAGDQKLVFDAGRGAMQRLTQLRIPWSDVSGVFLTHLAGVGPWSIDPRGAGVSTAGDHENSGKTEDK